jgi:exportin-7
MVIVDIATFKIKITNCVVFQALSCLVQFASTRRSLFSSPERAKYLGNLIKGVKRILENPQVFMK